MASHLLTKYITWSKSFAVESFVYITNVIAPHKSYNHEAFALEKVFFAVSYLFSRNF